MVTGEETRENRPSAETRTADGGEGDDSGDDRTAGNVTSLDGDAVTALRSFESNTISRTGRVLGAFVVDYSTGTSVGDVRETVRSTIAESESVSPETAWSRVVDSSAELLAREYPGVQAIVLVGLPSGDVFADRIPIPERTALETPGARRYRAFVDEFGDLELLPQLEGERVPIGYSPTAERWVVDLDDGMDDSDEAGRAVSIGRRGGVYALLVGLLAYGWLALSAVPSGPTIGAIGPQSLLLASMALLCLGFGIDLVRSAVELGEQAARSGS